MKTEELRIGNQVLYQNYKSVYDGIVTSISKNRIVLNETVTIKANSGDLFPFELTESNIVKVRCKYRDEHTRIEFSCTPPGERQVENNYWSNEVHDFAKLHLSPSYRSDKIGDQYIKRQVPEFWFIWITSWGTGSNWFMPLMDIHNHPLKYFHQLQNLYYDLTGRSLIIPVR